MAQNQNNNSRGFCKKICNKISSPFRTIFGKSHKPFQPNSQIQTTKTAVDIDKKEIQVFGGQDNVQNSAKSSKPSPHVSAAKTKSSKKDFVVQHKEKIERTKTNEKFSDYISKVKDRMTDKSNVSTARTPTKSTATKRDSFNDKVSNYIDRARIKIRTTANVGDDKGNSVK